MYREEHDSIIDDLDNIRTSLGLQSCIINFCGVMKLYTPLLVLSQPTVILYMSEGSKETCYGIKWSMVGKWSTFNFSRVLIKSCQNVYLPYSLARGGKTHKLKLMAKPTCRMQNAKRVSSQIWMRCFNSTRC